MPFEDDLPDKLSDLSRALEYGIDAALGKTYSYHARKEVMEKLVAAAGFELVILPCAIEERDEQ